MSDPKCTQNGTVEIQLPASLAEKARERAERAGVTLAAYLGELVERDTREDAEPDALELAIKRWTSRTPEQILADREEVLKTSRKGHPSPEGKTLTDVVVGTWPGDETDEEIREMLEKLS